MSETNKISMSKGMKIWLWFALVLRAFTTIVNLTSGRYLTVALAAGTVVGLCMMLFAQKRQGFYLLCICYLAAFAEGIHQGMANPSTLAVSIIMSLIGSAFIPAVTYLFLRKNQNAFSA